jgi:hypothetical protein
MSPLVTFAWGFAGSVAVEVVTLLRFYYADPVRLPPRYRRWGFWVTRLTLALLGGALAVGYEIDQAILAFNIGAATPLIITSLARGLRPQGTPPLVDGRAGVPERSRPGTQRETAAKTR